MFLFSSRRRHTRYIGDWSSDVCSSDLSDEEGDVTFSFEQGKEKGKEKEYKLVVKEKDGDKEVSGEFDARVVRLGVFWFLRSEERRVGKECRSGEWANHETQNN